MRLTFLAVLGLLFMLSGCAALNEASVRDSLEMAVDTAHQLRDDGVLTDERWDLVLPLLEDAFEVLNGGELDTPRAISLALRIHQLLGDS